ncbi:hypothetical protein [Lysinibacillus sphaericus]|uniref:Uncharacterized protein n=1 Tax=Lysinibacillus sphaericus (strain C3-41) TaxID=444177 RepID=B1HZT9_LYSSC|nr:hypothetical protein [Lysinibacillus sphaericus]ACA41948.1 hypothetical protein Bsph_4497 [Lysinibacillus sphaericus C3-41]
MRIAEENWKELVKVSNLAYILNLNRSKIRVFLGKVKPNSNT